MVKLFTYLGELISSITSVSHWDKKQYTAEHSLLKIAHHCSWWCKESRENGLSWNDLCVFIGTIGARKMLYWTLTAITKLKSCHGGVDSVVPFGYKELGYIKLTDISRNIWLYSIWTLNRHKSIYCICSSLHTPKCTTHPQCPRRLLHVIRYGLPLFIPA